MPASAGRKNSMIRAFWRGCLVVAAVLGMTISAPAQEKLVWKAFDAKEPFYQEMTTETVQTMTVMGMEVKQTQNQTFYMQWTPLTDKSTKDAWVVEQKIIGVKMNINIGGNNIAYDSQAKDQAQNPLTDFFKALTSPTAKFVLTINKDDMKVTKIDGRKEFIDELVKSNQQLDTLLKQILSEDALKQMADPTFAAIPPKGEIPKSGTWEKKNVILNMGPIGTYDTSYTYKVDEKKLADQVKAGKVTIDVTTTLTYKAPDSKSGALPFIIKEGKLEGKSKEGKIVFDVTKGRIDSSDLVLDLDGRLVIEIAGQPTEVTLKQTQTSKLKTLDTNPIK